MMRRRTALALATIAFVAACVTTRSAASAIPIFAQRYALTCGTCHTALPELNDFGNAFRNRGYRLPPAPVHGTTVAAIRYNTQYERDPAPGSRRFAPAASIVADADVGNINAYLHYNLGAGGAPAAVYLGFLSTYDAHTQSLYRAGLFELPLTQSQGQRLDSISNYGYFGTSVGLNDLDLAAPRLGLEIERVVGVARLAATIALGEFKGAAYGGRPVFTGATTTASRPEVGLYARVPFGRSQFVANAAILAGERRIELPGRAAFGDAYDRIGFGGELRLLGQRLELSAQQWLGHDNDADGAKGALDSSGGYLRLKYFATPHLFAAVRYDAAANPFPSRTIVTYAGALVGRHARVVIERRTNLLRGSPTFGGYVTIAAPWPRGL